ncbi:Epidermal growth factor-like protein 6 [Holothuria leucospilota]|uniref:Epidermal growth factor-like protein 6 n=1 Tax=Holothuria leucospilota TaxID=206669 RepID=A0A9Q1CKP0_HOLLE|nr:Epidermal growth factor-like protein 6 [Holothuria leucospilota]
MFKSTPNAAERSSTMRETPFAPTIVYMEHASDLTCASVTKATPAKAVIKARKSVQSKESSGISSDLNECGTEPRPCDHRCVNTQGSFRCYCEKGYVLLVDKQTCVRDRRCYPGRCSYACAFNKNEVTCVCPPGLRLIEDGYHCKDIDECAEGLVICPIYQECKNTFGNFLCLCIEGFEFQYIDGEYQCIYSPIDPEIENPESIYEILRSPIDPDILNPERIYATLPGAECSAVGHICSTGSGSCVSTSSGPRCKCIEGYHGDGEVCVIISTRTCGDQPCFPGVECKSASLPKSNDVEQLLTLDIIIPYECGACPVGYVGPGETCYDINECERGPLITGCHFHAFCENIPGDFICICSDGFFGNGTHCSILGKIHHKPICK